MTENAILKTLHILHLHSSPSTQLDNIELSQHTQLRNDQGECEQSPKTAKGMELICFNVRSFLPKLEEICLLAADTEPHLIGLVETWLKFIE